jgi:hypothetical protein
MLSVETFEGRQRIVGPRRAKRSRFHAAQGLIAFGSSILLTAACALTVQVEDGVSEGRTSSSIIGGRVSGPEEDFAVLVATARPSDGGTATWHCTGTVIAKSIVVTARHCAVEDAPRGFGCTRSGELMNPAEGSLLGATAKDITIYVGSSALSFRQYVKVRKVLTTSASSLCRDDVAVLILESPVDAPVAPIRISPARIAESVRILGWGRTAEKSPPTVVRQARDDVPIEDVGPGLIPERSFAIGGKTTCFGDSGGGAFVDGSLVGVYSRIDTGTCELPTGRNVYTQISPFRVMLEQAFQDVGEPSPWASAAPPPSPPVTPPVDAGTPGPEPPPAAAPEVSPVIRRGSAGACAQASAPNGAHGFAVGLVLVAMTLGVRRRRCVR